MKRITLAIALSLSVAAPAFAGGIGYNPDHYSKLPDYAAGTPASDYAGVLNGRNNVARKSARRQHCAEYEQAWQASFDWVADALSQHTGNYVPHLAELSGDSAQDDMDATLNAAQQLDVPIITANINASKEAFGLWFAADCFDGY